jgi:hypothetical protein
MSATTKPITAKNLKIVLEPFLDALNDLYDELLQQNPSSDIFSIDDSSNTLEEEEVETETKAAEDNSIMTVTKFLGLVKKKITQDKSERLATSVRTSYDAFVQYLVKNNVLLALADSNSISNIAILKEFNITFNFYEDTASEFSAIENLAHYKKYLPKWLKTLGAVNRTYKSSTIGVSNLKTELATITLDAYEKIGGTLCYSFFKLKRATQLKEERHDLIKRIFFELGLFKSSAKPAESFFAKMVHASPPLIKWRAAVTVYSTPVYSAYSKISEPQPITLGEDGYIAGNEKTLDNIFKNFQFKTILDIFNEAGYIKYAGMKRENYIIRKTDVENMREYATSNNLELTFTDDKIYEKIANLFGCTTPDDGIPILAPWLSVNGISSYIRENSSNDGMPIFAGIFEDFKSAMQPESEIEDKQFPRNIEYCCEKNKLEYYITPVKGTTPISSGVKGKKGASPAQGPSSATGKGIESVKGTTTISGGVKGKKGESSAQGPSSTSGQGMDISPVSGTSTLCWICGCPITSSRACDHFHPMLAMSILINIKTQQAPTEICKNFGYTHPGCNSLKSQHAVSIMYGLIGSTLFKKNGMNCVSDIALRKAYFDSLSAFQPKPISDRVNFYMKSLLVKLTLVIFNKNIVKHLYKNTTIKGIIKLTDDFRNDMINLSEVFSLYDGAFEKDITNLDNMFSSGDFTNDVTLVCEELVNSKSPPEVKAEARKVLGVITNFTTVKNMLNRFKTEYAGKIGEKIKRGYSMPKLFDPGVILEIMGKKPQINLKRSWSANMDEKDKNTYKMMKYSQKNEALVEENEALVEENEALKMDTGQGRIRKLRVNKQRTRRIKRKKQETIKRPKKSHVVSKKKRNLAYKRHNTLRLRKKFTTSKKIKKFKIR